MSETKASPNAGRDESGRFTKGNPGGRGNPFARRVAAMRQVLLDAVSAEDLHGICKAMVQKAREGDVAAAKLVLTYVVGKPAAVEEPDRMDETEWQQRVRNTVRNGECEAVTQGMTVQTGNLLGGAVTPAMQEEAIKAFEQGLRDMAEEDRSDRLEEEAWGRAEQAQQAAAEPAAKRPPEEPARRKPVETQSTAGRMVGEARQAGGNNEEVRRRLAMPDRQADPARRAANDMEKRE